MIPGYADGGRPEVGKYSLVGERGPELVKFDQPATVYSNDESRAAMNRYNPMNQDMGANAPMTSTINYNGPTLAFNGIVTSCSEAGALVAAGAKQGEQRAMNRLRQSRSTRSRLVSDGKRSHWQLGNHPSLDCS